MRPTREQVRAEIAGVARLAAPVVVIQLGLMLMGTVDSMMLGRVSETALAAGALGNAVALGLVVLPMGILMALDPLVAQAFGAGDHGRIARHLKQGLVLALVLAVPMALVMWWSRDLLRLLGQQPEVIEESTTYLRCVLPGYVAYLAFVVFRQTLQAMGRVGPMVLAILLGNAVNVFANYVLVFGHLGFPPLGVAGAAWATSISRTVVLVSVALLSWPVLGRYWRPGDPGTFRAEAFRTHLRLGFPIGVQISVELWLFVAVGLLMGHLGARQLAGHQIALNLTGLAFMVPLGIAGAAAARVGNAIGRRDDDGARLSAAVCLVLGPGVMIVTALLFSLVPRFLARLFTPDPEVVAMAAALLPIAAVFELFDGTQVVSAGVLRGSADTRIPALLAVLGYWGLGLPLGWYLGLRAGFGPQGLWWGLTAGLASAGTFLVLRVRRRLAGPIVPVAEAPTVSNPS